MCPRRIILIVLDSLGIGELPDASLFNDVGSHTLGNMARAVNGLQLPHLEAFGLGNIAILDGVGPQRKPLAAYGKMTEISAAKDTSTGHWELMGLHLKEPFPVYPEGFPEEVVTAIENAIGRKLIGNKVASGTEIIEELGPEHLASGNPILYTSADSVLQLAAHEKTIPVEELYQICQKARGIMTGPHQVTRVIARPFIGEPGHFERTANRHDYSILPPEKTVMDHLKAAGLMVHAIGKIDDIFAGQGITQTTRTKSNQDGIEQTVKAIKADTPKGLIFTNLVDFDMKFGHRRNVQGYAEALMAFDQELPDITKAMQPEDLLILTADHGNDPTFSGTDHTREYVPLILFGKKVTPVNLGVRSSFADLGATIAHLLNVEAPSNGENFASLFWDVELAE